MIPIVGRERALGCLRERGGAERDNEHPRRGEDDDWTIHRGSG